MSEVQLLRLAWPSIHCLYFIYARKIYMRTHVKISRSKKKKTQGKKRRFNKIFFSLTKVVGEKNAVHATHLRRFFKTSVEKSLLGKAQYCPLWRLYWYESNGTWMIAYKCYTSHLRHDLFILRTIKGLKRMLSRQKKIIGLSLFVAKN